MARELLRALAEPFQLDGHEVSVSGSIGITTAPADGGTGGGGSDGPELSPESPGVDEGPGLDARRSFRLIGQTSTVGWVPPNAE